jgi:hypothetical protein
LSGVAGSLSRLGFDHQLPASERVIFQVWT